MLIRFRCENYRSIKDEVELNMTVSKPAERDEMFPVNCVSPPGMDGVPVARIAALYGANASGKSNIVKAMRFARQFILESSKESRAGDPIPVAPHIFRKDAWSFPSSFEFVFVAEGVRYQYGFSATRERVTEEWLHSFPHKRKRLLFEREFKDEKYEYQFGTHFRSRDSNPRDLRGLTRANALFLSVCAQFGIEAVDPISKWFLPRFNPIIMTELYQKLCAREFARRLTQEQYPLLKGGLRGFADELMKAADPGIKEVDVKQEELKWDGTSQEEIPQVAESLFRSSGVFTSKDGSKHLVIEALHEFSDAGDMSYISLPFTEESSGTQRLLSYALDLFFALSINGVLVIDEIESSLHPLLVRSIIELFHKAGKENIGQLIFTTHNTNLLSSGLLLRDQVWFAEKKEDNSTDLYSLADFSPRKDANLEKGYLLGKYGAIPYLGDIEALWRKGGTQEDDA